MIPYISIQRLRKITDNSVRTTDDMAEIWITYLTDASIAAVYTYLLRFYTNIAWSLKVLFQTPSLLRKI
jgi:hypothetical protein